MKTDRFLGLLVARTLVFVILIHGCWMCQAQGPSSWNLVLSNSPVLVTSMAYGNGTFVGCGNGRWAVSHDGTSWSVHASPPFIYGSGIQYGNGQFMAYGMSYQNNAYIIIQSTNGINWTQSFTTSNDLNSAVYGNNTWVFISKKGEIVVASKSLSGLVWTDYNPPFQPINLTYANGLFIMGSDLGDIWTSSDGIGWEYVSSLPESVLYKSDSFPTYYLYSMSQSGILFGNGVYIAASRYNSTPSGGYDSVVFVSSNLVDWVPSFSQTNSYPNGMPFLTGYSGNQFIVYSSSSMNFYTSSNGISWTTNSSLVGITFPVYFTYGQGVLVNSTGTDIYKSDVYFTNSSPPPASLGISTYPGVTINGGAGNVYQIQYSADLNTWQTITNIMLPASPFTWVDMNTTITSKRFYRSVQLQ